MKVKTSKGFTLAELLIVMAIIVVLAAVAIPTFGKQLETSRETGDMEIIRNAYTEALSIATLDGADGNLNGVIGDASATATLPVSWGAISIASGGITAASGTNGSKAVYTVTLSSMGGAAFSQAEATNQEWKYVNPSLAGRAVPVVDTSKTKLTFKFEITTAGDVVLVADEDSAKAINATT